MTALWLVPVIFIFFTSILIWFTVGGWGKWWLRLVMIVVTCAMAVWAWVSIDSVLGYPKPTTLDKLSGRTATLYWTVVQEPAAIYLWVRMDGSQDLCTYKLPYSRPLHKETEEAKGGNDKPIRIRFGSSNDKGQKSTPGYGASSQGPAEIYVLPQPKPPEKPTR